MLLRVAMPKVENVMRGERFQLKLNSHTIEAHQHELKYAANGRDTRVDTVKLGPYLEYELALALSQLRRGENHLELHPTTLVPGLVTTINLREIELIVRYSEQKD